MKKTLIYNSIFGVLQLVVNVVLIFLTIPLFIKMLGIETYGIFSLIMIFGNLNVLVNLGLNSGLIKFIAEQGKTKESNVDILVALILVAILILPLTFLAIYFNEFILINILNISQHDFLDAKCFFIWVIIANAILIIGQIFKAILDGIQKIHITSIQQTIYSVLYWVLILITLKLGYRLPEIGISIFLAAFIWFLLTFISVIKIWGGIHYNFDISSIRFSARKQLKYGLQIYSGGLIAFLYEPLSKLLVSHFIGISAVGFYDIALKLKNQIWGIIATIFYPLFPFISEQKDFTVIRKYVHDIEQKIFLMITPMIAMSILLMRSFITIWIGNNVEIISITSIFLISFHLIGSTVIPNYQFLLAKNLVGKTLILQFSNVIFNTIFFLLTIPFLGYYSLIAGSIAAIMSSFFLSIYYQKKYLNSMIFDSYLQIIKILTTFLILITIGYLFVYLLKGHNILILIIIPIILIPLTLLCYKIFGLINKADIYRYLGKENKLSISIALFFNN